MDQSMIQVPRTLDNPWRGAEASHLMLLTQRLLNSGSNKSLELSLKCTLRLPGYEDYLNIEDIYCILALSAIVNRRYDIGSKAFIKLESSQKISDERRDLYKELSLEIL